MLKFRSHLARGASMAALGLMMAFGSFAHGAETQDRDRYMLHLATTIFDGSREFSHSQAAGFARIRQGNESYVQLDYHEGAVAIDTLEGVQVGRFNNESGQEAAFQYDYDGHRMSGQNDVAETFNTYIRPFLVGNVELGEDATWSRDVSLSQLGLEDVDNGTAKISLSRKYFQHEGREYVLVKYAIPAFNYTLLDGTPIIHWGNSAAVLDAQMGEAFWNATLHRSVAGELTDDTYPYRYNKSIAMMDGDGHPVLDIQSIPELWDDFAPFFNEAATEVVPFSRMAQPSQAPIKLAARLDVLGLALAENSGNQLPLVSAQSANGSRGLESPNLEGALVTTHEFAQSTNDLLGYIDKGVAVGKAVYGKYLDSQSIRDAVVTLDSSPELRTRYANSMNRLSQAITDNDAAFKRLNQEYLSLSRQLAEDVKRTDLSAGGKFAEQKMSKLQAEFDGIERLMNSGLAEPKDMVRLGQIETEWQELSDIYRKSLAHADEAIEVTQSSKDIMARMKRVETLMVERSRVSQKLTNDLFITEALNKALPPKVIAEIKTRVPVMPLESLSSNAKRLLGGLDDGMAMLSHANNAFTTGKSFVNAVKSATRDTASGELSLTRNYGDGAALDLGLDLVGLVANAMSGDVTGVVSDGIAIVSGSVSDIFVSAKGLRDVNALNADLAEQGAKMSKRLRIMKAQLSKSEQLRFEVSQKVAESELSENEKTRLLNEISNMNVMQDGAVARLQKIGRHADENTLTQAEQDEFERKAKANLENMRAQREARRKAELEARLERERRDAEEQERRARIAQIDPTMADAIKPDYPTRPPIGPKPKKPSPNPTSTPEATPSHPGGQTITSRVKTMEEIRAENLSYDPYKDFDLEEYQKTKLELRRKAHEEWLESIRNDEILGDDIGGGVHLYEDEYGITHIMITQVNWDAPEWDPPKWVPPNWEPPKFEGPEFSGFEWSSFDEDDGWPRGYNNLAIDYNGLSGKVATDTSPWDEWIEKIGRRKLERLAKQAGYPNLASALTDWANLLKNANDPGWVRWAMTAPSCAGYAGCGPQYLERWAMKTSQLELGRLISDSRDVFSTAGLSDIAIFGFNLEYALRDFGLEDGDLVQVVVKQFGRTLLSREVSLLNAGTDFNVRLNPGVASVEIVALNEGAISPNTAEIEIENVAEGEGTQSYSLLTGEQATLRVESGR